MPHNTSFIGARRELPSCRICGGHQFERYEAKSGYQGQEYYEWVQHRHTTENCLKTVLKRIEQLERRMERVDTV